jgi:cell division protein FtsL
MWDLAPGIEERNYGLRRTPDLRTLWESLKIILPMFLIAGALSFHIWIRSEIIHSGYQMQEFSEQEKSALQLHEQLILEEQTLKNPEWLEQMASNNLGMILLRADQIITIGPEDSATGGPDTLAMGASFHSSDSGKESAFN